MPAMEGCHVQNYLSRWTGLGLKRQIAAFGVAAVVFAAVLGLSRMATTPGMALLYSGLDSATAGEVVAALDQRGVAYAVQGDTIRVDASLRDSLRMTLAAEGLPASGTAGYELLDGLSGFGTTSQMFDAAYLRAKEGELARTITANPAIRAARVHIAVPDAQPFQRDRKPTASVTVTTRGAGLTEMQARAVRHLVAAAVAGMRPEDVELIDAVAGLIPSGNETPSPAMGGDARAAEMKRSLERLLAARVGSGRAIVEVSVEVETEREELSERTFDPQGRVAISTETKDTSSSATQPGADVTVASNLPEGDAGKGGDGKSSTTESTERINYEVSEKKREVVRAPGAVRRLSVAVLVDGTTTAAADGTQSWAPRSDEELGALRELVASAAGISDKRGDVLTLKSMQFDARPVTGEAAEAGMLSGVGRLDVMTLIQIGVLAAVALILGLFVLRPLLSGGVRDRMPAGAPLQLSGRTAQGAEAAGPRVLTGEIGDFDIPETAVTSSAQRESAEAQDPMTRLRRLIEARQAESVEVLRGWMEAEEEQA